MKIRVKVLKQKIKFKEKLNDTLSQAKQSNGDGTGGKYA